MKTRIYFLDNLRTFLIFLVIILHSAIAYTPFLENMWIVNDLQKGSYSGYVVIYLDIFVMFIMFFISGYFIPTSYQKRSFFSFVAAKFKRIMIPWIIAVFTIIPAYKYIFLYSRGLPQEEWFTYFHLFAREGGNMGFFADSPTQSWLWFLPVLFIFQIFYALLARMRVLKIPMKLNLAIMLVFSLSLVYSLLIAANGLNGWHDDPLFHFQRERLLSYFLFFLLGSLCYKLKVFEAKRKRPVLNIVSFLVLGLSIVTFSILSDNYFENIFRGQDHFVISEGADGMLYYTTQLLSVITVLYLMLFLFKRYLNRTGNILSVMSRNSYTVYIIHMVVMGALAFTLLHINMPVWIKITIVSILTLVLSNLIAYALKLTFREIISRPAFKYAVIGLALILSIFVYASIEVAEDVQDPEQEVHMVPTTSIHMAAIYGDTAAIRQHILAGTDINKKEPTAGSSPLISASLFGKTEVARMLIKAGADVNFKNNDGSTALHTASFFCRENIVILLLENGADKSIQNNDGSTALFSVQAPWDMVSGIYEYFNNSLAPLGLKLNFTEVKESRPKIAKILAQ